ncbi:CsbD family protein [Microbacterium tumbae]
MGIADKAKHAAEDAVGHIKEGVGKATDNEDLEREGRIDQAKADLKKAGDDVKDAFEK